jgi:hypothetical protein
LEKPALTEDLYIVPKEEFSVTSYMCDDDERSSIFIRDKLIRTMTIIFFGRVRAEQSTQ